MYQFKHRCYCSSCHPFDQLRTGLERSEESPFSGVETLRFIQGDTKLECNYPRNEQLHSVYFYYADPETTADKLNPLPISHTARTISFKPIGIVKKIEIVEEGLRPNIPNKPAAKIPIAPIRPQTDKNRGTSLD